MSKQKVITSIITIVITIVFLITGWFKFKISYLRFIESINDLFNSSKFYIFEILKLPHSIVVTVENLSTVMPCINLPKTLAEFIELIKKYLMLLVNKSNFEAWFFMITKKISKVSKTLIIITPSALLVYFIIKKHYKSTNNNYNKDTKPLIVFKKILSFTYFPIKKVVVLYIEFLKRNKNILYIWLTIWLFNFNIVSIFTEFIAYYLYFAVSFKFETIYVQFVKLIIDMQLIYLKLPWWVLILVTLLIINKIRKRIAINTLRHFEAKNCGFINELPIVSITCGSMGKRKTTVITDMALTQEVMFRQKALSIIQKTDLKLPYFPWICFEKDIQKCLQFGTIYNLATIKHWILKKKNRFEKHKNSRLQLYNYDIGKYGSTFNDALKISGLFDILDTYALAFFIYLIESSLIVSNYSIRTEGRLIDQGNFPVWIADFFNSDISANKRFAHILDFDILRLGKKVLENNANAGSFEFGVVAITEIGKERGNNLELKEIKKGQDETNQKNDLFNSWLKMCRHSATIDNYPFIKVFTDEQRPESWGADARDLCEILNIISCGKQQTALPFFYLEEMVYEWLVKKFIDFYYDIRFNRGDNTLIVYLLKKIAAAAFMKNLRLTNLYGYSVVKIEKERGTMDGKKINKKYYLMNKKIYSSRFSTDCFSDFFNEMAKNSKVGINDYLEYENEKATVSELKKQNSYFIKTLY